MSKWAALVGSNTAMVVSATVFAVAAIGAGLYINSRIAAGPDAAVEISAPAPEVSPPTDEAEDMTATATDPQTAVAETPPSIDEVRVEPDGLTIVAGRASPGSKVFVLLDGVENTSVTTDAGGGFAAITMIEPKTTAQVLTIVQRSGDTTLTSPDEIILAPSSVPQAVAEALPATSTETNTRPNASAAIETPEAPTIVAGISPEVEPSAEPDVVEAAPAARQDDDVAAENGPPITDGGLVSSPTSGPTETLQSAMAQDSDQQLAAASSDVPATQQQITVLKSTSEGVEVLRPRLGASESMSIDTISYSDTGGVQLSGRAKSDAQVVRVYVNNRPVAELRVDAQGRWRGDLPDIDTGVYTLRLDEVDASGDVLSRVETPFRREDPQVLIGLEADPKTAKRITVQTGSTLWAIARERYGEGALYVQIYDANRNRIVDPDLIYPGQIFALPD